MITNQNLLNGLKKENIVNIINNDKNKDIIMYD